MKKALIVLMVFVITISCNYDLTRTKPYLGTTKEILTLHLGDPSMTINNQEKGEILVYFFNKRTATSGPFGAGFRAPQFLASDKSFVHDIDLWNYVVFLVDPEDIIYKTEKIYYTVSPQELKRMLLERYN